MTSDLVPAYRIYTRCDVAITETVSQTVAKPQKQPKTTLHVINTLFPAVALT